MGAHIHGIFARPLANTEAICFTVSYILFWFFQEELFGQYRTILANAYSKRNSMYKYLRHIPQPILEAIAFSVFILLLAISG